MKNLIIVRHGSYNDELKLSRAGTKQMEALAKSLQPYIAGDVRLLSSTADRATESAGVLAAAWGIEQVRGYDVFWSDQWHDHNLAEALRRIRMHAEADTIVVVTHLEYAEELPPYIGKHLLNASLLRGNIEKGEALVIDCQTKMMSRVQPT